MVVQSNRKRISSSSKIGHRGISPFATNFYPNWELIGGSDIVQDVPTGNLPTGHTLAFNSVSPCDATYIDNGDGTFDYLFNPSQATVRLGIQQLITGFEVGKRYRFRAECRSLTTNPAGPRLRVLHIANTVDLNIVDENQFIDQNVPYTTVHMDFEVTSPTGEANFRWGIGLFATAASEQQFRNISIYELF